MNKQEAIEKIKDLYSFVMEDGPFEVDLINKNQVIDLVSQIDKPQKVVVPKEVAEWLEYCKIAYQDLQMVLSRLDHDRKVSNWVYDENDDLISEKVDMIARAWLDVFEIEQEKLYTVEIPDPHGMYKILYLFRNSVGNIRIGGNDYRDIFLDAKTHLTEYEIKQDFEWAFQFAKPVEVE